jgi:hypothetical protein
VEAAAAKLEDPDNRVMAADARTDAARWRARAGTIAAGRQAQAFYDEVGTHPELRYLPETHWVNDDVREALRHSDSLATVDGQRP